MKKHFEEQKEYYQKQGEKDGSGGHPTLAAWFDAAGQASGHAGSAYLGGELKCVSHKWELSNASGRFGRKDQPAESIDPTLKKVAGMFKDFVGIDPTPKRV
jgi:hypothetical protein